MKGSDIKKTIFILIASGVLVFTFSACTSKNYSNGYNNYKNRAYQGREADLAIENGRAYNANRSSQSRY